jgi:hypothetical protein
VGIYQGAFQTRIQVEYPEKTKQVPFQHWSVTMGNVHAAVLICAFVGSLAIANNEKTILDSLRGRRGLMARCEAIFGLCLLVLFFVVLVIPALSAVLEWLPETPGAV